MRRGGGHGFDEVGRWTRMELNAQQGPRWKMFCFCWNSFFWGALLRGKGFDVFSWVVGW